ncbi:MAG: GDP-mannose 4,6-dehydratase [Infirmifilum sp.]
MINGLLVPSRDSAALAEAIVTQAQDKELGRRLGTEGRKTILTWDEIVDRLLDITQRDIRMKGLIPVAGSAGFIGNRLVDRLINENYGIRVIYNSSTGRRENLKHLENNPNAEIIKGDLKNEQKHRGSR